MSILALSRTKRVKKKKKKLCQNHLKVIETFNFGQLWKIQRAEVGRRGLPRLQGKDLPNACHGMDGVGTQAHGDAWKFYALGTSERKIKVDLMQNMKLNKEIKYKCKQILD